MTLSAPFSTRLTASWLTLYSLARLRRLLVLCFLVRSDNTAVDNFPLHVMLSSGGAYTGYNPVLRYCIGSQIPRGRTSLTKGVCPVNKSAAFIVMKGNLSYERIEISEKRKLS